MTGVLNYFDMNRFISKTGGIVSATVYFYNTNSSVLAPIYTDKALTISAANPYTVPAGTLVPVVYLDPTITYRRRIVFSDGTAYDQDPLDNLRNDLASLSSDKGASLVKGVVTAANILDYGAASTTSTSGFDSTTAIQTALNTGRNVYVPPLTSSTAFYRISSELLVADGQMIFGEGVRSMIRQTTANANVIAVPGRTGSKVIDLGIWACGSTSSYTDGLGVDIRGGSERCEVRGCTVKNHLGWGIGVTNSNNNKILNNWLIESPATNSMYQDAIRGDIYIQYSSSKNIVQGNHCVSGNGVGIGVQSIVSGDICDSNQIIGNYVRDCKLYGIMAYRNAQTAPEIPNQSVVGTIIVGNRVENITGAVASSTAGYVFGAGIYAQGAENTLIEGNTIKGTHTGAVVFVEQLAPGAIGATNVTQVDIVNNSILNAGQWGIYVGDPNDFGASTGFGRISGNAINTTVKDGIKIVRRGRISITNNIIDATTLRGIYVANTVTVGQRELISISGNTIRNPVLSGMELVYCSELRVADNSVKGSGLNSIYVDNSSDVIVSGNLLENHAQRGLQFTSTVTRPMAQNNMIRGNNAAGTIGMLLDAQGTYSGNMVTNHVTDFAGTWKDMRTLTANSTTPSVLYGHAFVTANTAGTLISNLLDGYDGQEVVMLIRDTLTTIDFTASNMKGNGGVDWAAPINGSMRCIYNKALGSWFCTVQGA